MSPNTFLNKRNSEDYFQDKRSLSIKILIPITIFASMIFSVVYFYRVSTEKEMTNALSIMVDDLEGYVKDEDIENLESLITYEKYYKRYDTSITFDQSLLKETRSFNKLSIDKASEDQEILISRGEIFGTSYELIIYKINNQFKIIGYSKAFEYSTKFNID